MNKKTITILAIETSCDETACAVVATNNLQLTTDNNWRLEILSNVVASQIDLHAKFGGVYPELASRAHAESVIPTILESLENANLKMQTSKLMSVSRENISGSRIPPTGEASKSGMTGNSDKSNPNDKKSEELLLDEARSVKSMMKDIDAIAVTYGPGLVGSLVVGLAAAKTLAYVFDKPILPINHWEGHIYSNFVGECQMSNVKCQKNANLPEFPSIILTVSGGHTNIILMKGHGDYEILGQTLDDAAGEAFDKVARLLGLGYPGGPAISACAETYNRQQTTDNKFQLPRPMIHSGDYNFSFSGLKTAVLYKVKDKDLSEDQKTELAYEFQEAITDTLIIKTKKAIEEYHPKSICLCGGVSANKVLREKFMKLGEEIDFKPEVFIPKFELTTDNAAMIGAAGYYNFISGKAKKWYDVSVDSRAKLVR